MGEYDNDEEQMVQALFAETAQLQQQMHQLHEHLAFVAGMQNTPPQGEDLARALHIAGERVAKAEAAARNQLALAEAEQQRAMNAEAREHQEELLLSDAQTRELMAEQREIQF